MNDARKRLMLFAVASLLLIPTGLSLGADEKNKNKNKNKNEKEKKEEDKKPELPKFDEVTKDMEVKKGFFTLYHDEKKDKLLCRVPKSMLGKRFLLASTVAGGPHFTGFQWDHGVHYWERMNKKLVLMEANPRYKKGDGSTVEDVIGRTYPDRIVQAVDIVTEASGGDPVLDLGDLFKTDFSGIASLYHQSFSGSLSKWATIKTFPDNVEIAVDAVLTEDGDRGGRVTRLHYSLSRLPDKSDYKPRAADDRVGHFVTAIKDWTTGHREKTVFRRYAHRWHLKRVEPKADVSDVTPETQIVFYLEKTIPKKYRRYVREGVLEWSKAFEKAGLRNAIQVLQQTDTIHTEKDPEDVRYNFIRWIVTGRGFARGPSRVDPFTGRILDADIVIDDSMVRYMLTLGFEILGPKALSPFRDADVESFLDAHPSWQFVDELASLTTGEGGELDASAAAPDVERILRDRFGPHCEQGKAAVLSLSLASGMHAQATGERDLPEEFIGQALKETVMHEVGHTLGLRHNFKASSWKSLKEIDASTSPDEPLTASVMDYNPYNFAAVVEKQGVFATPTVGPYDDWAIEYGYRQVSDPYKNEEEMLKTIALRAAEPGLDYATDEDTSIIAPDPLVNRFDNGDDPIAFARQSIGRYERLLENAAEWAVEDGESYAHLRRAVNVLLIHYAFGVQTAARTVGGQYVHRDHKADPDGRPPFEVVPAKRQREALRFLGETVLSESAFVFPSELLNHVGAARWRHWDSDQYDASIEFRIHSRVLALHRRVLFMLTNPFTIERLYDAQLKIPAGEDSLSVPELFTTMTDLIWSELDNRSTGRKWDNRNPRISSFRRGLQREHLRRLIGVVLSRPGRLMNADCHAVVRMALEDLGARLATVLDASRMQLDDYSRAHLDECKVKITKALEAKFTARR